MEGRKARHARGSGRFSGAQLGGLMQRNQGVGVPTASRPQVQSTANRWSLRTRLAAWRRITAATILCLLLGGGARAQGVNTASLAGTVLDPANAAVKGAKVTVTNAATGSERSAVSDDTGRYNILGLPPGQDKINVDGGS